MARLKHGCPPPLPRLGRRVQQQRLREVCAAWRHADQRQASQRKGEDAHGQRPSNTREASDSIVPRRIYQSGSHEHGGLVVLGLLPQADGPLRALKPVGVWLLVLLAGATVAQLIAREPRRAGPQA